MKLIDKIRNVKVNSKIVIVVIILMFICFIGYGINYCFYTPSPINKYIASNLYKTPANTAFEDDNFYQCVVAAYNNKNSTSLPYTTNLSDSQLETITSVYCNNEGVVSAKGVEKITTLTELYVRKNKLTSLDVSKNISLTGLDVYNNQLTSLDVSKNTALIELNAASNQFTSLDVSKNTALTSLFVGGNQLTSLDVSKNIALIELSAYHNQLTTLDVSKNTALTSLFVGGNQLASFDVNNNTALTKLDVSYNNYHLTSLDVSKNIALTELDASYNKLTSLDVSKNTALTELSAYNNQLTSLDVSGAIALTELDVYNNQLTSLDVSKNTALTELDVDFNQLTSLDVSKNTELIELSARNNQLTGLDVSKNIALTYLNANSNQLTSLDVSKNKALTILAVSDNQLTSLDVSKNIALIELFASNNQLTSLDVSKNTALIELVAASNQLTSLDVNNTALTSLWVPGNQLTSLDVSKNTALMHLNAFDNQLTSLDVSKNTALMSLRIGNNLFKLNLKPILLGDVISSDKLSKIVVLPSQLVPVSIITKLSDGLEECDDGILTKKTGSQSYVVTSELTEQDSIFYNTYTIEVVDIKSSKYNIDKTIDYIVVGNDDNDIILGNITVENGIAIIEDGYLVVKNGEDEVKRFKLIKVSSSVYDLNNDYIYVGTDTDDDIINNIETNAEISISDNNILNIKYGDNNNENYTLIRLNASYDINKGYIYTWDSNYLDNINVINGSIEIVDDNLIIKYNNIELDRIPILSISSDKYIINQNYIYSGLSDIDLNKINKSKDLELSINDNKVILKYKDNVIDEIPYHYLKSNSNDIRFSSINNKIYVKNTMMTYNQLLQYIIFNTGGQTLVPFDKNGNRIINNNLLLEEGSYITLYGNTTIKHIIEVNTEYVEYKVEANIHYTTEYGKDIIKNLNSNNTFINVRDLIETDGKLSILDKEDNLLEETSNIKTGDKFVVSFPSSNKYFIYLSVKGDVTGKGNISDDDVLESYSILRGKKVEDYYRFASDVTNDGQTRINDIAKLYYYVNNKIDSLE